VNSRLMFLAILGALRLPVAAAAQNAEFIQSLSRSDLTPTQNRVLDQISRLQTTEGEVQIVRINPASLLERSHFTLPLPGRSPVTIEADTKNVAKDTDFSMTGRVSGLPNGTATMVVNKDSVTGSIQTDSGLYRITPLGGGAHALVKVGRFPAEHPQ
jgi:hypothetical protein